MRTITNEGWQRIREGLSPNAPIGDLEAFWLWACRQGSGYRCAAYFILATADAWSVDFEGQALESWIDARANFSIGKLGFGLDEQRKKLISDFVLYTSEYIL